MSKIFDYVHKSLNDKAQTYYGKDYANLSKKDQSDNLSRLFVEEIMPSLGHAEAAELFVDGYVDGAGDLGCDVIIKVGENVHIIQSKYVGSKKTIQRSDIDTFQNTFSRLGAAFKSHRNHALDEILKEIKFDKDTFYMWFITNSKIENQTKTQTEAKVDLSEDFKMEYGLIEERVNWDYIDLQELYNHLTNLPTGDEPQGINEVGIYAYKKHGEGRSNIIEIQEDQYRSALMIIESEQIAIIAKGSQKNSLFDFNIRNYLGENRKNKKILQTAKESPNNFFLYNNGISAICESFIIDTASQKITAKKFSVINGAQTVRTLAKLQGGIQPKVLLRVTEITHHKDRNQFLTDAVRFNNTQNEIKSSDFRSNDQVQLSFKNTINELRKDGKVCAYISKRTDPQQKAKMTYKVDMVKLAKAVANYKLDPYELLSMGQTVLFNLDKGTESNYVKIFGKPETSADKQTILEHIGIFFLSELLDEWLKNKRQPLNEQSTEYDLLRKNALERAPIILWVCHLLAKRLEVESQGKFNECNHLIKLAQDNQNSINSDSRNIKFWVAVFDAAVGVCLYQYAQITQEKVSHRQWTRGVLGVKGKLEAAARTLPSVTAPLMSIV